MQKFRGTVKPYIKIDGLGLEIRYNEEVDLDDWQISHKHFQFAFRNGWVVSVGKKPSIPGPVESKNVNPNVARAAREKQFEEANKREAAAAAGVLDPTLLHQMLEKQTQLLKNAQHSYESLKNEVKAPVKVEVHNDQTNKLLSDLAAQQQKLIELFQKPTSDGSEKALGAMMAVLKELQAKNDAPAPVVQAPVPNEMVDLLKDIKSALQNGRTQVVYNKENGGAAKQGFQIQDFEEKFVPKVEDLEVKSSKIVTQQTASGGTDDALAALKALKQQQQKKSKE